MSLFIYAVVPAESALPGDVAGIGDRPLSLIAAGRLGAVVSDCPGEGVRAERRNIAATERVLRALRRQGDLLPVAFGTLAQSRNYVLAWLERHEEVLAERLVRLAGAAEMGLRVRLEGQDPIAYLVERLPELRAARNRTFGRKRAPGYNERIALGRLCEEALQSFRKSFSDRVSAALAPFCTEIKGLPPRDDAEIVNLATLVSRDAVAVFEAAVEAAAAEWEDEIAVTLSGPWPPHHFAQLDLPS